MSRCPDCGRSHCRRTWPVVSHPKSITMISSCCKWEHKCWMLFHPTFQGRSLRPWWIRAPQKGPENWCCAKLVEESRNIVLTLFGDFWHFCPARKGSKSVKDMFETFWRFLMLSDVAPFRWLLLRSHWFNQFWSIFLSESSQFSPDFVQCQSCLVHLSVQNLSRSRQMWTESARRSDLHKD